MRNDERGEVVLLAVVVLFVASILVSRIQLNKIMNEEQITIKAGTGEVASAR